jgi:pimeloyl-ACP methyl ester carboxylesterase
MTASRDASTFVLVPGAWHGAWCYRLVGDLLRAEGHGVFALSLTGLAERSHLGRPDIDLSTHIADVANLIAWEDLTGVVLCGHSYGGMVVSGVAECVRDRISSVVLLDAFIPENGRCALDYLPADRRAGFVRAADDHHGMIPPIPAAAFNVNEKDRAWVDAKCTPQPFATFTEPASVTGALESIGRKAYVRATAYPAPHFDAVVETLRSNPAWRLRSLPCGHDLMIDRPAELAALLAALA